MSDPSRPSVPFVLLDEDELKSFHEIDVEFSSLSGGTVGAGSAGAGAGSAGENVSSRMLDNRYELVELLGRGAMGDVWVARDVERSEHVAVKILREDLDDQEFVERFWREARILSRIHHPNIIEIKGYGADPKPYLVVELLTGQDLTRLITNFRRLPLSHATEIFSEICTGLAHVHEAGVIHRDIKPANIFCVASGPVKLVDFGLSKKKHTLAQSSTGDSTSPASTIERFTTKEGTLLGTVKYMSPEQAIGGDMDFRTDLWSAAVVLFKMLTGKDPYEGADEVDLIVRIIRGTSPPVPSRVVSDLPPELDSFFERAFQRHPEARYGSATEMASAFEELAKSVSLRGRST